MPTAFAHHRPSPRAPLFNSVLPAKVYAVFYGHQLLGQLQADDVHEAYREAKAFWQGTAIAVIRHGYEEPKP